MEILGHWRSLDIHQGKTQVWSELAQETGYTSAVSPHTLPLQSNSQETQYKATDNHMTQWKANPTQVI